MRNLLFFLFLSLCFSCTEKSKNQDIVGSWELLSARIHKGDSSYSSVQANEKLIKIFKTSHFAFLRHDVHKGKDSLPVFVAGGGEYTFENGRYTEYVEFLNYREWEGKVFEFNASIANDTLTISGIEKVEELGVDHKIIEVYKRL